MADRMILDVERLAAGGDGIAFFDTQAIFIPFSIPGEKVSCEIVERSRDFCRAKIIDIIEPSAFRVKPPCPVFGICGGCSLQHIEYSHQLAYKTTAARESFRRIAKLDSVAMDSKSCSGLNPGFGYRNRVQVHFTEDHGLGYMEAGSASSVRAAGCPIATPTIDAWLRAQNRKAKPDKELMARIGQRDRIIV
ncbi:MAG: TRAM domain-containing protein, partial [Rectinemataceae bacterium]|nr:TRAM domain-containing protein [Rectinemataceae bacterium]